MGGKEEGSNKPKKIMMNNALNGLLLQDYTMKLLLMIRNSY